MNPTGAGRGAGPDDIGWPDLAREDSVEALPLGSGPPASTRAFPLLRTTSAKESAREELDRWPEK
jgi:hypothetical protein